MVVEGRFDPIGVYKLLSQQVEIAFLRQARIERELDISLPNLLVKRLNEIRDKTQFLMRNDNGVHKRIHEVAMADA